MTVPRQDGRLVNLAARSLGASVMAANDESFGEKENLLLDKAANFSPGSYGHKGEIVDGWETRRRGAPGFDWALIRLGSPGRIEFIDVDTSFFTGNYPPQCLVEACGVEGYPSADQLNEPGTPWEVIVSDSALNGDTHNLFDVSSGTRYTHVRLKITPDGGVARLRVVGQVIADPRLYDGHTVDLLSRNLGGVVEGCSDDFYSDASALTSPGLARDMGEGWETRRRRDDGHDWAILRLGAAGRPVSVEVDTSYYKYNASKRFALFACHSTDSPPRESGDWAQLLPPTDLQPDTRHRFALASDKEVTHVRFDVFPDGGVSRLRLFGGVRGLGRRNAGLSWFNTLPEGQAIAIVTEVGRVSSETAERVVGLRPLTHDQPTAAVLETVIPSGSSTASLSALIDGE
jgi:allantoicase